MRRRSIADGIEELLELGESLEALSETKPFAHALGDDEDVIDAVEIAPGVFQPQPARPRSRFARARAVVDHLRGAARRAGVLVENAQEVDDAPASWARDRRLDLRRRR